MQYKKDGKFDLKSAICLLNILKKKIIHTSSQLTMFSYSTFPLTTFENLLILISQFRNT